MQQALRWLPRARPERQMEIMPRARRLMAEDLLTANKKMVEAHARVAVAGESEEARRYALETILYIGRAESAQLGFSGFLQVARTAEDAELRAEAVRRAVYLMKDRPRHVTPAIVESFQQLGTPEEALAEMRAVHEKILAGEREPQVLKWGKAPAFPRNL
jgi:hypothetical protein